MTKLADQINQALPQTQCGLCDYAGCAPYAEAIANGQASIDRCPPGGIRVLKKLADITQQDPTPYGHKLQMNYKPPSIVVIREPECIGCTKCIQVCPVDAIIGRAKKMHTVLITECTGCDLCVPACPVDCIDIIPQPERSPAEQQGKSELARQRYEFRQQRLVQKTAKTPNSTALNQSMHQRQQTIQAALARLRSSK